MRVRATARSRACVAVWRVRKDSSARSGTRGACSHRECFAKCCKVIVAIARKVAVVYDPAVPRTFRHMLRNLRRRLRGGGNDAFSVQRALITRPEPVILDIGAHIGRVAREYRRLFPLATIHCFEPFPPSFARLERAARGDTRMSCHAIAVAAAAGAATLQSNASPATNSLLATDAGATRYWGRGVLDTHGTVRVVTTTIDEFAAHRDIGHVDILKLDIQGGEYDALLGARALLAAGRVSLVYAELILCPTYAGQRTLGDYMALLGGLHYEFLDFYNPVRRNNELMQVDAIFLSASFNAERRVRLAVP